MATYLPPVDKPKSPMLKFGYYITRRQFGKVFTPLSVYCARLPTAFTSFYGKLGRLDKKLALAPETALLIRQHVATLNQCGFCMDASRFQATKDSPTNAARFDDLSNYGTSARFDEAERAALDYATELTLERHVTQATFDRLASHYSEEEICNVVWLVASEHLNNLTNIGLNIGSDGMCELKSDSAVR